VLLDIMMPELNGHQVLEQLKAAERLRHIPVIMISVVGAAEELIDTEEVGALPLKGLLEPVPTFNVARLKGNA
jgi:CheY-like chemotaxis protein